MTKLIVTARIRGNVLLKMSFLHILKIWKKKFGKTKFFEKNLKKKFDKKIYKKYFFEKKIF